MKLELTRQPSAHGCTIGKLMVNGRVECYTLEDVVRQGPKVYGETAIPAGTYTVAITFSNRFKRDLPLLLDVPGFDGIRIHPGNSAVDTLGCILVGVAAEPDRVTGSRIAFNELYPQLLGAWSKHEPITITIKDAP